MASEADPALWRDPSQPVELRVADLMGRMTPAEKTAQLYGVWVGIDHTAGQVAPQQHELAKLPIAWEELIAHGIGQLTRPFGTSPVDPTVGAKGLARSQHQIMAAGRFGIPALVHEECLTGLAAWQAPVFPAPLCWAASFDPDLVERMGHHIGKTMRRLGIHQGLAPVLDVARDLRWGRVEETMGEDPYLVGTIGSAYVRGVESAGIVATLKHFVGYSASKAGRNLAPVSMGRRELYDVMLPPFEMALRAGARSVMNSYTDIDGVPVAADPYMLTELLRERLGFTGTVVSDYFSVKFLETLHGVALSSAEAAGLALAAGIDVELPTVNCFGEPLRQALADGDIPMEVVDRALERVLRQKAELGLLDADWSAEPAEVLDAAAPLDDEEARGIARDLARRSVVLLHNNGVLPLAAGQRMALIGPRADDPRAMLGCYSFPMHVGVHHPDVAMGVDIASVTAALGVDHDITYVQGCPVLGGDDAGIAEAVAAAAAAQVCVAVLGDQAGLFGGGTSGEGCDAVDLRLPGRQEELLEAVLATGTPVVLVLLVGRPYDLSRQIDRLAAVVCSFFPGEQGGPALADVLNGRSNPSGRLPVSFPGAGASQPSTYLAAPLARRNGVSVVDPTPLFPFGHGLSYAPATWMQVDRCTSEEWATDGATEIVVTLGNTADRDTSEIVQVYLHLPVAEVVQPVLRLVAASRVELAPGQQTQVVIELPADLASYTGADGARVVSPGPVELHVGASSGDIREVIALTLTGARRVVGFDRALSPRVSHVVA
jgi:beta-glucosidase